MSDYFSNFSGNAYHVCYEDGPTKGIYMAITGPMTLIFQGHKCVSNGLPFNLKYIG